MDQESLQSLLDQGLSVERIGQRFGKDPSTVAYWMKKYGLVSPYREKHAAKGGLGRSELEALVDQGLTIAEIAESVGLSKTAVRHWLQRYALRTNSARRRRPKELAEAAREAVMRCKRHGETDFVLEGRGRYRCRRCRSEAVVRHRQKVKTTLVGESGGGCAICGYSRNPRALQFHHLDPSKKRLALSQAATRSLEVLRTEARKCVLLCANCHAEVEDGVVTLPLELTPVMTTR
jgi:transposase